MAQKTHPEEAIPTAKQPQCRGDAKNSLEVLFLRGKSLIISSKIRFVGSKTEADFKKVEDFTQVHSEEIDQAYSQV